MKSILLSLFIATAALASPSLEWQIVEGLAAPESVYFDPATRAIYISNIGPRVPGARDGNGWIQKISQDGQTIAAQWAVGLNNPKGMRSFNGQLWVADIDQVVTIDLASGSIRNTITIPGAKFLNDIAIDTNGDIYVSDTSGSKIYRIRGTQSEVFAEGNELEWPNGLLVRSGKLIVAAWGLGNADWSTPVAGGIYSLDLITKRKTRISQNPIGNLDGLEIAGDGSYLTSDYSSGKVFKVAANGQVVELAIPAVETVADIGYIPATGTLLVPYTGQNQVKAFSLEF